MLKYIKRYELSSSLSADKLENKGFVKLEKYENNSKVSYYSDCVSLYNDIVLYIDIMINDDGSLSFNDLNNVIVMDEKFNQPYTPFYENKLFHFLGFIIFKYNEYMDNLVKEGILTESTLSEEKSKYRRVIKKD